MLYSLYVTEVKWWNEHTEKEQTTYEIYAGESYADVIEQIVDNWGGDDEIISMQLTPVGEGGDGSISISKTIAEALIYDIPSDCECLPSEWRKNHGCDRSDS